MLNSVLLITTPDAPALATDLATLGVRGRDAGVDTLLREALRADVQAVVAWDPSGAGPAAGAGGAARAPPAAGAAVHERRRGETLAEALRCGVQACGSTAMPARLRPLPQLAEARFERENALRNAHDELAHRFEERKLVDRAKGILMRSLQIPRTKPSACCAVPRCRISSASGWRRAA